MRRVIATGRTVDDAVTSALVRLGVTRSQASIRVLREPVVRLFGFIRTKEAEVEVTALMSPEETAKDFLSDVLEHMQVDAKVKMRPLLDDHEAAYVLEIVCDEEALPIVIGRHGVTLDSLQYLVNTAANRGNQDRFVRFRVDAGDYRRRRKEGLWQIADRAAERALRTKKPVVLDVMPSADRKVIHTYLQDKFDVTTTSEGSEPHRKVVVVPVTQAHSSGGFGRGRGSHRSKDAK